MGEASSHHNGIFWGHLMARRYKLFGTYKIEENGSRHQVMKSNKACALLAYLIVKQEPQPREHIADLIGEAATTKRSLHNLRQLLSSSLRNMQPELRIERKWLAFVPQEATFVDLYAIETALATKDDEQIDAALQLYDGDLLTHFYLKNAPRFNEWLQITRELLRAKIHAAHRDLCTTYDEKQAWEKGIAIARHWIKLDDLNEDAYYWLMQFLAQNEQAAEALNQYDICCQRMKQELDVAPNPALVELAERLKKVAPTKITRPSGHVDRNALEQRVPSAPGSLPPNSFMPYHRNETFVGRADSLRFLANFLLLQEEQRMGITKSVVITGMGGVGKTQLAVEYAYRYGRYYPGGVYWLSFAQADTIQEEIASIGGEGGIALFTAKDKLTLSEKVKRISRAWQDPIPRLLVFDNCEDENLAAHWLPVTGGCHVLLTSRRPQWPPEIPITPFPLPVLPSKDSVVLLQTLARHITANEATNVAKELGDLPLALQLAGSYLRQYTEISVNQYLAQLQEARLLQHASLQGEHSRYSPTRHELNVSRTFAISLEKLDPVHKIDRIARQLLVHAAHFASSEPIPQNLLLATLSQHKMEAVTKDEIGLQKASLMRLIDLGLLSADQADYVTMHRLVVAFTYERLGVDMAAQTAVVNTLVQTLDEHRQTHTNLNTLPFSYTHFHHVSQQVLQHESAHTVSTARLIYLLGTHLKDATNFAEAEHYLQEALTRHTQLLGADHLQTADVISEFGSLFLVMGQYDKVLPYYEKALAIRKRELGLNHADTASTLNNIGIIHSRLGNPETALNYFEQTHAIRERVLGPEHITTTGSLNNIGVIHFNMGRDDQARIYFERVLHIRERQLGPNHLLTATTLSNLGDLLNRNGEHDQGRPYLERAVAIKETQLGSNHPSTLTTMVNLGLLLNNCGELEKSEAMLQHARASAESTLGATHQLTARIHNTLGTLYLQMKNFPEAQKHLEQALSIRNENLGPKHADTGFSFLCLGELYQAMGKFEAAYAAYQQASTCLTPFFDPAHDDMERIRKGLAAVGNDASPPLTQVEQNEF